MPSNEGGVNMYYWNLEEHEDALVERVYYLGGIIFVDDDGILYLTNKDNYRKIRSKWFDTVQDFKLEIEATKLLMSLKKAIKVRN